jgi:uncharacterized protein (DUF2336 family)
MIVRQFLRWIQTAAPGERADATNALARAYLYSDLTQEDRLAAEAAMTVLLDDPSPLVRKALADALAGSDIAPRSVVLSLAQDQPDIAETIAGRSPLLSDAELVDLAASGSEKIQCAIAARAPLSRTVAAALAEVGGAAACLTLIENLGAQFDAEEIARIAERHGHLAAVREELLAREDLPVETRQALVAKLSDTLARFVAHKEWLPSDRAENVTREACDRATVVLASETREDEVAVLIRHLVETRQLTGGLVLRALVAGNLRFFVEALAQLSGYDARRVEAIVSDRSSHGFEALYRQSGLPKAALRGFRAALEVIYESDTSANLLGHAVFRRRMVENVLARCEHTGEGDLDHLYAMLRKFAGEAAREEARLYAADLLAAA